MAKDKITVCSLYETKGRRRFGRKLNGCFKPGTNYVHPSN